MQKVILGLGLILSVAQAQADAARTVVACSSPSGRTIISGLVAPKDQAGTIINLSVDSAMRQYAGDEVDAKETVLTIDPKGKKIEIGVLSTGDSAFIIHSKNDASTRVTFVNGQLESGFFIGVLTGTNPKNGDMLSNVELRCHISKELI